MANRKITINKENAVFIDIKSAVSIAMFDSEISRYDGSIDVDVRRAVVYNKIVFENMLKRLFSYTNSRENNKPEMSEKDLNKVFNISQFSKEKVYSIENPDENTFAFLNDILDPNNKVRGYSEYILFSLFNHYLDYIKN